MAKRKPVSSKNVNINVQKAPKNQNKQKLKTKARREKKPINKRKLIIIIASVVLGLSIVLGIAFGVWYAIYGRRFDYTSGDIGKYITLSRDDYMGYEINATVPEPTQLDLDERILQILAEYKSTKPQNNGYYYRPDAPIANGWKVRIWYRGYTLDEDGRKIDIDGTCNFASSSPTELEIGSGDFVSGFEISLIGKSISDYSRFSQVTRGNLRADDIIIVTMNAMYPDGRAEQYKNHRIDLSSSDIDELYGGGFRDALVGAEIGATLEDAVLTTMPDGTAVYTDIRVSSVIRPTMAYTTGSYQKGDRITVEYTVTDSEGVTKTLPTTFTLDETVIGAEFPSFLRELLYPFLDGGEVGDTSLVSETDEDGNTYSNPTVVSVERREDKPITVDAYFPYDYGEETLRGKAVKFDVYVVDAVVYDAPALTDEFLTDRLKITEEKLADYEGDTVTEKYRNMVKDQLWQEYQANLNAQLDELVWRYLISKTSYDEDGMPKGELRFVMNSYIEDFEAFYELNKKNYESRETAAMDYFEIGNGSLWRDYVRSIATQDIVQQMIFYYIARAENFLPDDATLRTLYDKKVEALLADYLEYKGCDREDYDTEEEYLSAVSEYRELVIEMNGEDAITEAVRYEFAMPKIIELATVNMP